MSELFERLRAGQIAWLEQDHLGTLHPGGPRPRAVFAGSFNPLHRGHRELAEVARRRLQAPVHYEVSIANVDKPELSTGEITRRLSQFVNIGPILTTRCPTFVEKSALFPEVTFVVGADTAVRVVESRYYGGEAAMQQALSLIRDRGCRFLVGGRLSGSERFVELVHLAIPREFQDLFEGLSESEFRVDLSSTELRMAVSACT